MIRTDMKRITNPWRGMEGYRCYGCDPHSEQGLRMEFYEDGEEIVSVWHPRPEFQGWVDTLHGGVQATLADEISSWVVFRKFRTSGVTSRMEVRYQADPDLRRASRAACRRAAAAAQPGRNRRADLRRRRDALHRGDLSLLPFSEGTGAHGVSFLRLRRRRRGDGPAAIASVSVVPALPPFRSA